VLRLQVWGVPLKLYYGFQLLRKSFCQLSFLTPRNRPPLGWASGADAPPRTRGLEGLHGPSRRRPRLTAPLLPPFPSLCKAERRPTLTDETAKPQPQSSGTARWRPGSGYTPRQWHCRACSEATLFGDVSLIGERGTQGT